MRKKRCRGLDHVKKVYSDDFGHIINFLAHRVQRPQEKINHALLLGGKPGIGKDTWRVLLIAIAGEPLLDEELPLFEALTNRKVPPATAPHEFFGCIGRRGGKSRAMAVLAVGCHPAGITGRSWPPASGRNCRFWRRRAIKQQMFSISSAVRSRRLPRCGPSSRGATAIPYGLGLASISQ